VLSVLGSSPPARGADAGPPTSGDAGQTTPADAARPAAADAGQAPSAAAAEPVPLDEVVVTGSKTEVRGWDSTVPTQVIPESVIRQTTTVNIQDVLGGIPGMYIRRNEQFGLGASTVRMQGVDPNKVAILIDGRRFRGGINGVVDLRDIPANNVQRIEIIRGPASSLYGSDAMAGVINIITKQGGPDATGELSFAGGSFNRRFVAGAQGWQVGPVRYFLSGVRDSFRLFEQFGAISQQFTGPNQKATQDRNQLNLRLDWEAGTNHRFTLFPSYQETVNPDSTSRNIVSSGEWRWRTTPTSELVTWLNRYDFSRSNTLPGFEENSTYVDWEGESRWGAELGSWRAWTSNRVTLGTRVRQQSVDQSPVTLQGNEGPFTTPRVEGSVWQISPFLQSDVMFTEKWSLQVGSSFDVHELYGLQVNPRATLTWRPFETLRLSGSVGRGFRAPDLVQLFGVDVNFGGLYALLGNRDLQPETDLAFQFEAQMRRPGVDAFFVAFRHQFNDLIAFEQLRLCIRPGVPAGCVQDPLPTLPGKLRFRTENLERALTQGFEFGVEVEPLYLLGIQSLHRPTLGIGYAYLDTENQSGIPGENGNDLPFRPRHRVLPSLGYQTPQRAVTLRIWGEYESDAFTTVQNDPIDIARNHWLWNFKITIAPLRALPEAFGGSAARAVDIGRHLEMFVQGDNVFNEEFGTLTGAGRLAGPAAYLFGVAGRF